MRCPRCEDRLVTFAVAATGESAVVCESCGFAGVPASHHPEEMLIESWDDAIDRFDESVLPADRTCTTDRAPSVSTPGSGGDPTIDPERLDESVPVATSLRDGRDERPGDRVDARPGDGSTGGRTDDREHADTAPKPAITKRDGEGTSGDTETAGDAGPTPAIRKR